MTETETESESRPSREVLGGAVILLGAIPAFAIAMALKKGLDASTPDVGGIAKLATGMMGAWGKWPAFLASAGVAFVGAAIFVGVIERDRMRAIVGTVVASLGLAALAGAVAPGAGGLLGEATGGLVATHVGAWAGVVLGLAVIAGAVWLGWLHGRVDLPALPSLGSLGVGRLRWPSLRLPARRPRAARAEEKRARARAREDAESARLADALTRSTAEGVSTAEANALVPDARTLRYMEEVWNRARQEHTQVAPMPPSPYPPDVRLRGEIPAGAKPLSASGAPSPRPAAPGSPAEAASRGAGEVRSVDDGAPYTWTPEPRPRAAVPAPTFGAELDPFLHGGGLFDEEEARALAEAIQREGALITPPSPYPPGVRPLGGPRHVAPDAADRAVRADGPGVLPPRPTWEQAALEAEGALADGAADLDELAALAPFDDVAPAELDDVAAHDPAGVDVHEHGRDGVDAATDDDGWIEEDEADDEDDEDEDEDDDEDEDEDEDDDEDEDEDDDEDEDEDDDEDEDENEEEEEEDAADFEVEDADPASDPLPVAASAAEVTGDAAAFADDGLEYVEVDGPAAPAPTAAPRRRGGRRSSAPVPAPAAATERQVTLRPATPRSARAATLQRAGDLFVHEGRVAVSLLQRQLGLDFDDACAVLDELQEAGLIGPYKGGQKRDILLTAEEWAARCAST